MNKKLYIIKIGTSSLTAKGGDLDRDKIKNIVRQVSDIKDAGHDAVIVTSGSIAAGFRHSDSQAGFKALRGEIGRKIFSECEIDRFAFDLEMLMRAQKAGCTFVEMPIKIINHRESSIHLIRDSVRMLRDIIRIKRELR